MSCGVDSPEMSVKPTMSEKKIVTWSNDSGSTFFPDCSCRTTCSGKTSWRRRVSDVCAADCDDAVASLTPFSSRYSCAGGGKRDHKSE